MNWCLLTEVQSAYRQSTDWTLDVDAGNWPELPSWCWPSDALTFVVDVTVIKNEFDEVKGLDIAFHERLMHICSDDSIFSNFPLCGARCIGVEIGREVDTKTEFANLLTETLSGIGFRRRGLSWHRAGPMLYSIVNLQSSNWGPQFYVNFGFSVAKLAVNGWIPESKCMLRFRIEAIQNIHPQAFRLLNRNPTGSVIDEEGWCSAVSGELIAPIAGVLEKTVDLASLNDLLNVKLSENVMVHHKMRRILDSL